MASDGTDLWLLQDEGPSSSVGHILKVTTSGTLLAEYEMPTNSVISSWSQPEAIEFFVDAADGATKVVLMGERAAGAQFMRLRATPSISVQPVDQTATSPGSATFSVSATASGPVTYEWQFNGVPISGATSSSFIIPSALAIHAGYYQVVVSNPYGSVVSDEVTLTVTEFESVVVPSQLETTDEAYLSPTLDSPGRVQQIYSRGQFPQGPIEIQGIRFRMDYSFALVLPDMYVELNGLLNDFTIKLTTLAGSSAVAQYTTDPLLSTTFSANVGSGGWTTVLDTSSSGSVQVIAYPFLGNLYGPKLFEIYVPFTTPFTYDPADGDNLVVDITNVDGLVDYSTSDPLELSLSGSEDEYDGAASVVSSNPSATTGTYGSGADAMQFVFKRVSPATATHVLPRNFANGDQIAGAGTFKIALRSQQVYGATELPPGPIRITALRFRPDYYYGAAYDDEPLEVKVSLSTTTKSPDGLSTTFASNVGADETVVFNSHNNAIDISSAFDGPSDGPKAFDIEIPLTTPFDYNAAEGNLLLETVNYTTTEIYLSGSGSPYDSCSRMFAVGTTPTTGSADTGADALELVYVRLQPPAPSVVFAPVNEISGDGTLDTEMRSQQVYARSLFPNQEMYITGIRFRPDYFYATPIHAVADLTINLSSTLKAPDSLSTTFNNNVGTGETEVFDGPINLSTAFVGGSTGPMQFDIVIPFKTKFYFDARTTATRNLLVDITSHAGLPTWLKLSGSSLSTDGASRVFNTNTISSTGSVDTGADAIEFLYEDYP